MAQLRSGLLKEFGPDAQLAGGLLDLAQCRKIWPTIADSSLKLCRPLEKGAHLLFVEAPVGHDVSLYVRWHSADSLHCERRA
jgi:hypothetical protein